MKQTINKKMLISIILILLLIIINLPIQSQIVKLDNIKESEIVIVKIKGNIKDKIIDISINQTEIIINELSKLKTELNQGQIDYLTYFEEFLRIFKDENILPKNYTLEYLLEIAELFNINFTSLLSNIPHDNNKIFNNNSNNTIPIHFGRSTIISSISIGNYLVRRIIPIKPYGFYTVISKEFFKKYILESDFTYAAACFWIPGPRGYHVLYSFNSYPGFENYSQQIFNDRSIGGFFLLGVNISLEAISKDGDHVYFDATIGFYGTDIMIGF